MNFSKPTILVVFFLFATVYVFNSTTTAQTATSSPYSRYGIGDIGRKSFGQGFAMGGASIALQNDSTPTFFINAGNPASYAFNRYTTAELGVNYNRTTLLSSTAKEALNNASLAYIAMAFPVKKWWGVSIGLLPFSTVGYNVSDHQEVSNVGDVDFLYEGSGGINQVYFGNGIKPFYGLSRIKHKKAWQGLSIGANASYLFGNLENTKRAILSPSTYAFNSRTGTTTQVKGLYLDYGMQYAYTFDSIRHRDLKENVKVVFGANFASQTNIGAKIDTLSYSYFYNSLGAEIGKDTIQNTNNAKGEITLPLSFGIGITLKKGDRWMFSADAAVQNWSHYLVFNKNGGLKNSKRVAIGAQYIPNPKASASYWKRTNYRVGLRYGETALELKNTPLVEYAASLGVGLPVGRNYILHHFSMINIGIELGQRGTTTNGLIKENFLKATIGFTINDLWFLKPKFD